MKNRDLEADLHPSVIAARHLRATADTWPDLARTCAYGCTIRGQHRPTDAEGNPQCPAQKPAAEGEQPAECRGCQPRPAQHGWLCPWCWQRLNADVVDIPHLARHLRRIGYPDTGRNPDAGDIRGGDPAYRIPIPHEWQAADELANALVGWVRVILEEHPANLAGPDMRGVWWSTQTLRQYDDETHIEHRRPAGIRTLDTLDDVVRWLLPHLPWVAEQDWVAEMRADLATQVATNRARWPQEERGHVIDGIPCPLCDLMCLWYSPPTKERPLMQVHCTNNECGRIFTEKEWDRMRALVRMAHLRGKAV